MIGRKKELKILTEACESDTAKLIAVYGRRRIGKTYLINHMFTHHTKECLFFRFTGSYTLNGPSQIENFVDAVNSWFNVEPNNPIQTWTQAFNFLKNTLIKVKKEGQKAIVFLDEVPWIDKKGKDGFVGALGYFWNDFALNNREITMIICGSNSSWIKNKLFEDSKGPLYQRLDIKIAMKPFDLKETKDYLINKIGFNLDEKSIVEAYMIFGGVAKYLDYLDPRKTISENVDDLIFNIGGHLHAEYAEVFKSLFDKKAPYYSQIIKALGDKKSGMTQGEIIDKIGGSIGAKLKEALEELCETGFILAVNKIGAKINSKYIISDPFVLFYNSWVSIFTNNQLVALNMPYFGNIIGTQKYTIWAGFAFETACLINIDLYLKVRQTKGLVVSYGYWSHTGTDAEKGAQIDLLVEYKGGVYDIVECKFWNKPFEIDKDYADKIKNKIEVFTKHGCKGKYDVKFIMLSTYGCAKNSHYHAINPTADLMISDLLT